MIIVRSLWVVSSRCPPSCLCFSEGFFRKQSSEPSSRLPLSRSHGCPFDSHLFSLFLCSSTTHYSISIYPMLKIESTGQLGAAIVVSVCEDERSGKQALSCFSLIVLINYVVDFIRYELVVMILSLKNVIACDHESGGSNDDIDSIGSDCNDNISKIYGDINKSLKKAAVFVLRDFIYHHFSSLLHFSYHFLFPLICFIKMFRTVTVEPFTFFSSSNDLVLHGILIVEILLQ